jgi:hypothetical protein
MATVHVGANTDPHPSTFLLLHLKVGLSRQRPSGIDAPACSLVAPMTTRGGPHSHPRPQRRFGARRAARPWDG